MAPLNSSIFTVDEIEHSGTPDVLTLPQSPVEVIGFKTDIDNQDWLTAKVRHSISDAGFTSGIELETRTEEVEAEREDQVDPDPGIMGVIASWREKVSKKQGEALAGSRSNIKALAHVYANKQTATRAAKLEWEKIRKRREIIRENADFD